MVGNAIPGARYPLAMSRVAVASLESVESQENVRIGEELPGAPRVFGRQNVHFVQDVQHLLGLTTGQQRTGGKEREIEVVREAGPRGCERVE